MSNEELNLEELFKSYEEVREKISDPITSSDDIEELMKIEKSIEQTPGFNDYCKTYFGNQEENNKLSH